MVTNRSQARVVTKSSKSISITCHPAALAAWRCWTALKRQQKPSLNSPRLASILQPIDPLWAIKSVDGKTNNFQFFAGFCFASAINLRQLTDAKLMIYPSLTDEEIEIFAWKYLLKTLVFDLDKDIGLGSFYALMKESFPKPLCKSFIGKRTLSKATLSKLTGVSESSLRWQLSQLTQKPDTQDSMLSQILNDPD